MILKTNPQEKLQIQQFYYVQIFFLYLIVVLEMTGGFGDNPSYRSFDVYLSQHTTILWSAV